MGDWLTAELDRRGASAGPDWLQAELQRRNPTHPLAEVGYSIARGAVGATRQLASGAYRAAQAVIPDALQGPPAEQDDVISGLADLEAMIPPPSLLGGAARFLTQTIPETAGGIVPMAAAAVTGGLPLAAAAGGLQGAEHGLEASGGDPLAVAGHGIVGALGAFGPGGALARRGVTNPILREAAGGAIVGGASDLAGQTIAAATYNPDHELSYLQALESAGALAAVGGVMGAAQKFSRKKAKPQEEAGTVADEAADPVRAVEPVQEATKAPEATLDVSKSAEIGRDVPGSAEITAAQAVESATVADPLPGSEKAAERQRPGFRMRKEPAPVEATEPTPVEAVPADPTSVKNRIVDRELEAMGLPEATHAERLTFEAANEHAAALMEADPFAGQKLLGELRGQERPVSGEEVALLTRERNRLRLERDTAEKEFLAAKEAGDPIAADAAKVKIEAVRDEFASASDVVTRVGTKNAQGLALRRMEMREDYSLAAMEQRARVANDGEPLNAQQSQKIKELSEQIAATQRAFDEYVAKRAPKQPRQQGKVIEFISARANEARERIKARGSRAMAGLDPIAMADHAIIGAEYLAKDISAFADWSKAMVTELGETIRPHLQAIYQKALAVYEESGRERGRLQGVKTRTAKSTEELVRRIAQEDFGKRPRPEPIALDAEAIRLKTEHEKVKRLFNRELQRYERAHRTKVQVAKDAAKEVLDLPRAVKSSWDLSAPFRQGAFFTLGHPVEAAGWVKRMVKAAASEDYAHRTDVEIRSRPGAAFAEQSKLELTRHGDDIGPHEEAIRSRLSDKIPGIKASNRAFITFLNLQRAHMFDVMVASLPEKPTLDQGKAIANAVNVASGRGNPGKFAPTVNALSHVLWSPRLLLSRIQLATGQPLVRGDAATRKLIAKEYARALIGISAVYALAQLAGREIGDDPRSSDFGKIITGGGENDIGTRIDPLAGLSQVLVLGSRLTTGEVQTLSGRTKSIRGETGFGDDNSASVIGRFLRTKLTPVLGAAVDALSGENVIGEPVTPAGAALQSVTPLAMRDVYEAMQAHGVEKGAALAILALMGMGIQVHEQKAQR